MAASAIIAHKLPIGTSLAHEGGDIRLESPSVPKYHMVPVGEFRDLEVKASGEILFASRDGDFCDFSIDDSGPFTSIKVNLPNEKVCNLRVHGRSAGRTKILAIDPATKRALDVVIVSVKAKRILTYNLHRLRDLRRSTIRTMEELNSVMRSVEFTYKRQANIELKQVHAQDTLIREDLSDPIELENGRSSIRNPDLVPQLRAKIKEDGLDKENLNLVSTWNLADALGFTPDLPGSLCLCSARHGNPLAETIITAHEIGHALGLRHEDHDDNFLMFGGANTITKTFKLSQFDIDLINTSGARFTS